MSFDTPNTEKALRELEQSGLFDEDQLHTAKTWLQERFVWARTPGTAVVGMSPNKTAEILGANGNSIQGRCRSGSIRAERTLSGSDWLIPTHEIIRLAKEAWGDTIGEENIGGESRRLKA